ncbi:MAG: RAMP superfamily CRISPR-associated protein [bacterium]
MIGWRLDLDVEFPEGLSPGESREGNRLLVARDGLGRLVLRGSALAGVFRRALRHRGWQEQDLDCWFGCSRVGKGDKSQPDSRSLVVIENAIAQVEGGNRASVVRTFHARDRHTGTVIKNSLFTIESWPPSAQSRLTLWIDPLGPRSTTDVAEADTRSLLDTLIQEVSSGLLLGGNRSRGLGRLVLRDNGATVTWYDLTQTSDLGRWLDDHVAHRCGGALSSSNTTTHSPGSSEPTNSADTNTLRIRLKLGIPRGQDFVVGDGRGTNADIEPQVVVDATGTELWRLPGSTLKGAFRAWSSRLAVREGRTVADGRTTYDEYRDKHGKPPSGEVLGWGYLPPNAKPLVTDGPGKECVIASLFGSLHAEGRIHVTDGYAPVHENNTHRRAHVAIDRITGGAVEGLFFDNFVIFDPATAIAGERFTFPVEISVRSPEEHEMGWLVGCLHALHSGLIRIGSSRAAGRLEIVGAVELNGMESRSMQELLAGRSFEVRVEEKQ